MGNDFNKINSLSPAEDSLSSTLQVAYLQNLSDVKSNPNNIDHSLRVRFWVDKPISPHWTVRGMAEGLFRLQPLLNSKDLKSADYASAGFPPRESGVASVDGVTVRETRRYSIQPSLDLFFLYSALKDKLKAGPRFALGLVTSGLEDENIPKVNPLPTKDCSASGDIYCTPSQPKPELVQGPPSVQQTKNTIGGIARLGGLVNYNPFSWLGVGLESYLQLSIYNGGSTLVVLRPEVRFTLPLQKTKLKLPDLFAQARFPATFDVVKGSDGMAFGYDLFLGLEKKFGGKKN